MRTAANHPLLDRLDGASGEPGWHCKDERLSGLEVNPELELRCLLNRNVRRLLAVENPARIVIDKAVRQNRCHSSSGHRRKRLRGLHTAPLPPMSATISPCSIKVDAAHRDIRAVADCAARAQTLAVYAIACLAQLGRGGNASLRSILVDCFGKAP